VVAKVDTSGHSGMPVARAATGIFAQQASQNGGPDVDSLINRIITANRGTGRAR